MKRVFGLVEAVFDLCYLAVALILAIILLSKGGAVFARSLAGIMALVLVGGDSFHLVPRIAVIFSGNEEKWRSALGIGKQITSITMTIFYVLLWHIALVVYEPKMSGAWTSVLYALALVRIILCLAPQNKWKEATTPIKWNILRNIPFFVQGAMVALLFFIHRNSFTGLTTMWLAIVLSFAFYAPVVLWVHKNPKIGMLMLPKTATYIWILTLLSIYL